MRSLKQYITESVKLYDYTIKIAGDVDKNFLDLFTHNLKEKFDAVDISAPSTTPIQKDPYGFPDLRNQSVTIIKANFRYPATEPMIQQVAQLLGYNVNMVRAIQTNYNDSINAESQAYDNEESHSPLLNHTELEEMPGAKDANKAYGDSYLTSVKEQMKGNQIQMQYSGKETPDAFDPFKAIPQDKIGASSPMSKITRPSKPATGARK
jgi:hypothetical protein